MLCCAFVLSHVPHMLLVESAAVGSYYTRTIMLEQAQEQQNSDSVAAAEAAQSLQAELRVTRVKRVVLTMPCLVTFCWT